MRKSRQALVRKKIPRREPQPPTSGGVLHWAYLFHAPTILRGRRLFRSETRLLTRRREEKRKVPQGGDRKILGVSFKESGRAGRVKEGTGGDRLSNDV